MTRLKKKGCILILFMLMMSMLAACMGGSNDDAGTKPIESSAEGKQNEYSSPFNGQKFDPPVTITIARGVDSSITFKNGETIEDNVHTRWAEEALGVKIETIWSAPFANEAFNTRLRLALSSNSDLPDILVVDKFMGQELIESGKFQEAGTLFEQYASETYKKAMADDPNVWLPYIQDGKKMGVPNIDFVMNNDSVLWIRQDWMDKLKLPAPKTVEDVERIMDAFVNGDPDGNNKKDTIGLATSLKYGFKVNIGGLGWLFGTYGTMPEQWNLAENGTLEYGSVQPEMKPALKKLQEWMAKGYLSEQAGVLASNEAANQFNTGKVGMIAASYWAAEWPLNELMKNTPGAAFKPYPLPTGPDGKAGRDSYGAGRNVILFNKNFKHPDAFFVYQNYLFDHFSAPAFGSEFEHGFAEGYDWAKVNGEPTTVNDKIPGGKVSVTKYFITPDGIRLPSSRLLAYERLQRDKTITSPLDSFLLGKPYGVGEAAAIIIEQKNIAMQDMFQGPATETSKLRADFLNKMRLEQLTKIVYGELPVDAFDKFVDQWMSSGGKEITKEVNEWYKSVSK
ncbi:MAG: sugar transporter [Paenibacillaceae bacterium]|nr:sugar transporter [Paenibacillaceae bacterium]